MNIDIQAIITVILGSGVVSSLMVAFLERRNRKAVAKKTEAEYADQISRTALAMMEPMKTELGRLTNRVSRLERQNTRYSQRIVYLMGGIDQLVRQISMRETPVWTPDDWYPEDDHRRETD